MSGGPAADIPRPVPAIPADGVRMETAAGGPHTIHITFTAPLDQWHQDAVAAADMVQDGPQAVTFTIPAVTGDEEVTRLANDRLAAWEHIIGNAYRLRLVRAALG